MPSSTRELAQQLFDASACGDTAPISTLLASPQAARTVNGSGSVGRPLAAAAAHGHLDVCRLLLADGADVDMSGKSATPLIAAADRGHLTVVRELLAAGAAVDARSADGTEGTALLCAAGSGHLQVVEELLAAGADVQARTALQWQPALPGLPKRARRVCARAAAGGCRCERRGQRVPASSLPGGHACQHGNVLLASRPSVQHSLSSAPASRLQADPHSRLSGCHHHARRCDGRPAHCYF